MTVNSVTAALFKWRILKLSQQQRTSDHQSDSLLPTKLFSFHITNKIFGLFAAKTTPLFVWLGTLESETAHFCTFCRHLKLASKNSRLVSSLASHHGLAKSIISRYFRVVSYSFSFRDNFYLQSHSIRRAACFWHDEKSCNDERDTRSKRLSGYSDWEYCCVSAFAY